MIEGPRKDRAWRGVWGVLTVKLTAFTAFEFAVFVPCTFPSLLHSKRFRHLFWVCKDSNEPLLRARCKACSARATAAKTFTAFLPLPRKNLRFQDQAEGWLTLKGPAGFLAEQGRHQRASQDKNLSWPLYL